MDTLEATLRLSRTEAASSPSPPLDRLLLAPHDMHRLGVRAGDWVAVTAAAAAGSFSSAASGPAGTTNSGAFVSTPSKQHERCSERSGVAVMRAWPATGMALPAGTVSRLVGHGDGMGWDRARAFDKGLGIDSFPYRSMQVLGVHPILVGQFTLSPSSSTRPVVVRPLPPCIPPAAHVRIAPVQAEGGGHAQQQFWAARLKDVLMGQALFPGLRLTFESFGARVSFEVMGCVCGVTWRCW